MSHIFVLVSKLGLVATGVSDDEKRRLLHCVVVGGGPTGVEFSGELSDFIMKDVHKTYSHVKDYIHVTLIEVRFMHFEVLYVVIIIFLTPFQFFCRRMISYLHLMIAFEYMLLNN